MKRFMFLFTLTFFLFSCEKDDIGNGDGSNEKPKEPEYGFLTVEVLSSRMLTDELLSEYLRKAEIEIFECTGKNIEKRKTDSFGTAFDKSKQTKVNAVAKSNNSYGLTTFDVEIDKEYYVYVKLLAHSDDNYYNNNGASSDTIVKIKSKDQLKINKVFSLRSQPNEAEKWWYPNSELPKPDFGVAFFGDSKEFVLHNDKRNTVSGPSNKLIYKDNQGKWYSYLFDDDSKFTEGEIDFSYQFGGSPTELIFLPINYYISTLNELKEEFGAPTYASEDVYSLNMTEKIHEPGYAFYEAQVIMNGGKTYTYTYANDRMKVESRLLQYSRSGKYQTWGFSILTAYSKK